jgi:hypothetical protein
MKTLIYSIMMIIVIIAFKMKFKKLIVNEKLNLSDFYAVQKFLPHKI